MIKQDNYDYRRFALRILLVVTIFSANIFCYKKLDKWLALFRHDGSCCSIFLVLYSEYCFNHKTFKALVFNLFMYFLFLVLYGIYFSSYENGLFAWLFIFPIISYLLLGRKLGTILTTISCIYWFRFSWSFGMAT